MTGIKTGKDHIWNPATYSYKSCEIGKYLPIIIDDSVNTCDKLIDTAKTIPKYFSEKR